MDRKKRRILSAAARDEKRAAGELTRIFGIALEKIAENPDLLNTHGTPADRVQSKKESAHIEYQSPAVAAVRDCHNDRVFPLETVTLQGYEQKKEEAIGTAVMHIGSYADEYARSFHALALTIGTDIYFRNGAYKPETEEGRKTIAHELAHVAQNRNRPLADNRTKDELEAEAVKTESEEDDNCEEYIEMQIRREIYKFDRKTYKKLLAMADRELEDWVREQEYMMNEKEYAMLLANYKKYLERKEPVRSSFIVK